MTAPDFLENPRRCVRAPLRCPASLTRSSGTVGTTTEDLGARGCCLAVSSPSRRGERIGLVLSWPAYDRPLSVRGTVAWASARPPWRIGVAFLDECLPEVARWLRGLIAADRAVLTFPEPVPGHISLDATLYLAPPPSLSVDFTDEELGIMRNVRLGAPSRALLRHAGHDRRRLARAVFALLSKQALTLSSDRAADPQAWARIVSSRPATVVSDLDGDPATPTEIETFEQIRSQTARTPAPVLHPEILPELAGVPSANGLPRQPRSAELQMLLNLGLAELELDHPGDALVFLRRALVLAPGDPEIAKAIARASGRLK